MGFLRDDVTRFFTDDGWELIPTEVDHTWVTGVSGDNGRWSVAVQVHEPEQVIVLYSLSPADAPVDRFDETIEFVTRANAGMVIGNFEFDYDDGGVRFKTSIDVEGLAEEVLRGGVLDYFVRDLAYTNVGTFDKYLPALLTVIRGESSPATAIAMVEG